MGVGAYGAILFWPALQYQIAAGAFGAQMGIALPDRKSRPCRQHYKRGVDGQSNRHESRDKGLWSSLRLWPGSSAVCVGIVTKVGQVFNSVCIGIHQGCQPIFGFNYGARRYAHVKTTYRYAAMICMLLGLVFLLCVELLPRQIVILFGAETEDYIAFAVRFLRIYLMMSVLSSCFILISGFFTAIGRPGIGALLACVKYFFTLIPLILILPTFAGVSGIAFSGPISDFIAIVCAFAFARAEFRKMDANTRTMD